MTSCGRGRDSATRECFGRGSQGTIFVRSSKLSLFFPELCPFRRVFCFPRFWKIWRQTFKLWGFWFRRCLGGLFENSAPSPGIFFANSDYMDYDHKYFFFWKLPFFFPKQSRCYLPDRCGDRQAEQLSTLVMEHRRLEWKLDFCALARPSAEGPWIVVAIGTSRVWRSMLQKRKKNKVGVWLCEGSTLHHLQTSEFWGACFRDPMWLPFRTSLFSWTLMYSCRTVRLRRGGGGGEAKKSSHPWHFRYWSLRRNDLECTNLVRWAGALHRFSSRDAIIVVGFVLEKHFGDDFTRDQEKEITFKRWPPGYQSWKLGLALNGLITLTLTLTTLIFPVSNPSRKLLCVWKWAKRVDSPHTYSTQGLPYFPSYSSHILDILSSITLSSIPREY